MTASISIRRRCRGQPAFCACSYFGCQCCAFTITREHRNINSEKYRRYCCPIACLRSQPSPRHRSLIGRLYLKQTWRQLHTPNLASPLHTLCMNPALNKHHPNHQNAASGLTQTSGGPVSRFMRCSKTSPVVSNQCRRASIPRYWRRLATARLDWF